MLSAAAQEKWGVQSGITFSFNVFRPKSPFTNFEIWPSRLCAYLLDVPQSKYNQQPRAVLPLIVGHPKNYIQHPTKA